MAEIVTLPNWKKNATAYERLSELALLAKEQPEKFDQFAIVYREMLEGGKIKVRTMTFMEGGRCPALQDTVGLMQLGILVEFDRAIK